MEENKKNKAESEKEIVYSQTVKAGKRIYYIDVKKTGKTKCFWLSPKAKR